MHASPPQPTRLYKREISGRNSLTHDAEQGTSNPPSIKPAEDTTSETSTESAEKGDGRVNGEGSAGWRSGGAEDQKWTGLQAYGEGKEGLREGS